MIKNQEKLARFDREYQRKQKLISLIIFLLWNPYMPRQFILALSHAKTRWMD